MLSMIYTRYYLKIFLSLLVLGVGGPIDVAVISKGDGFVWIKRKHYFKAELNLHFLDNYCMEACRELKRSAAQSIGKR